MPASWSIAALGNLEGKSDPLSSPPPPSWWRFSGFMMPAFSSTRLNFVACMIFQAAVCVLCVHDGPTIVHRVAESAPRILGRWLTRKGDGVISGSGTAAAANAEVDPPLSVAQTWKLGALHERFVRGREESNLREAGDVLGRSLPLTEEELMSLARVSARAGRRPRGCCSFADCVSFSGIVGGICAIGWALDDLPEPIRNLPGKVVDVASDLIDLVGEGIDLVGASEVLVCLTALTTCLTLVCEGLRAADSNFGGRIALGGVAGAVGTLWCSSNWFVSRDENQVMLLLLLFSLPLLASVAAKLEFALGGVLTVLCAFASLVVGTSEVLNVTGIGDDNGVIPVVLASLTVDALFSLAVTLEAETRHLQLFASGVMATGVFALHLTLFFNSFPEWDDIGHRILFQLPVFACLAAGWSLGGVFRSEGLKNNALFFGAVYIAATIFSLCDRFPGKFSSIFVGMLSLGAWRSGLYLRRHDGFVASLWTLDAGLVWRRLLA